MTPGSVAMLLGETTGLRVQTTSPALGAANVRIQGLRGHYSQLVADGLPLYGAQGDSFSLLQVPPLDLGQVEIIKGAASALYGASALGGMINLVSRRPAEAEREFLINATSQSGQDLTSWLANPIGDNASWTLLGGYHRQSEQDLDDDGWLDLPGFERLVLRPRVFTDNGAGRNMFATMGIMAEDRDGGTAPGGTLPNGMPFTESLKTRHVDGGFVGRWLVLDKRVLSVRGSYMRRSQDRRFGPTPGARRAQHMVRRNVSSGQSAGGRRGSGVSHFSRTRARFVSCLSSTTSSPVRRFSCRTKSPSRTSGRWLSAHAPTCIRSTGVLATPRISVLARPSAGWTVRVAAGTGAFAPTPFTEETEETGPLPSAAAQRPGCRARPRRVARRHARVRIDRGNGDRFRLGRSRSCRDEISRRWVGRVCQRAREHAD